MTVYLTAFWVDPFKTLRCQEEAECCLRPGDRRTRRPGANLLRWKFTARGECAAPRAVPAAHAAIAARISSADAFRAAAAVAARSASASGASTDADSAVAPSGKRKLLFVGDSLITGVGCSPEGHAGPALPRAIAEAGRDGRVRADDGDDGRPAAELGEEVGRESIFDNNVSLQVEQEAHSV